MPQRGVTVNDVEEAMDALIASGEPVNVRNVRRALGDRGSLTTLVAHMREVRARDTVHDLSAGPTPGRALPDPVLQGLMLGARKHWDALNNAADAIIEQARTQAADRVEAARAAERDARAEADTAHVERDATAAALAQTETELEALRSAHATLAEEHRARGIALELSLERERGAESLAEERRDTIESTTATLERTAGELDRARAALDRLRTEADARERGLTERVTAADAKYREAEQALVQLREQLSHAVAEREQSSVEKASMRHALGEMQTALDAERSEHVATARELAAYTERCDGLRSTLAQSRDHAQSLAAMLERANERAVAAESALRTEEAVAELRRRHSKESGSGLSPP